MGKLLSSRVLLPAILLIFLFSTNRYLSLERDNSLIKYAGNDSFSYLEIAKAFPGVPGRALAIPFHHAQRGFIPYLIGGFSKATGISLEEGFFVFVCFFVIAIVAIFEFLLSVFSLNGYLKSVCLLFLVLNPYTFRYYLAIPFIINDLSFQLGVLIVCFGLFNLRYPLSLFGLALASLSRQTALLLLPFILIWLFYSGVPRPRKILWSTGFLFVGVAIYLATGRLAANYAAPNTNGEILFGFFSWLKNSFDLAQLIEFCVRAIIPFTLPLAFLTGLVSREDISGWPKTDRRNFFCFLGAVGFICVQPMMSGPEITGSNVTRLTTLAIIPFIAAIGIALKGSHLSKNLSGRFFLAIGLVLGVGSFHHMFSVVASDSKNAVYFAGLHFSLGIVMFLLALYFLRPEARRI